MWKLLRYRYWTFSSLAIGLLGLLTVGTCGIHPTDKIEQFIVVINGSNKVVGLVYEELKDTIC